MVQQLNTRTGYTNYIYVYMRARERDVDEYAPPGGSEYAAGGGVSVSTVRGEIHGASGA